MGSVGVMQKRRNNEDMYVQALRFSRIMLIPVWRVHWIPGYSILEYPDHALRRHLPVLATQRRTRVVPCTQSWYFASPRMKLHDDYSARKRALHLDLVERCPLHRQEKGRTSRHEWYDKRERERERERERSANWHVHRSREPMMSSTHERHERRTMHRSNRKGSRLLLAPALHAPRDVRGRLRPKTE